MKKLRKAVSLRRKNQLTLPKPIAQCMGAKPGDRLVLEIDDDEPGMVQLRRLLPSYAGVATGIYGTEEEVAQYLRGERASWGE